LARVEIDGEVRMTPSCAILMGVGTGVENLKRVALLGSGPKPSEFDPIFEGKLKSLATKVYGRGELCHGTACLSGPC
jgi:hypothetical protein